MTIWDADGQLYEMLSSYETSGNWAHELQALQGNPGDGPSLRIVVPDENPEAATIHWNGAVRSMPLAVLRRFLDTALG
ncbi:MAG TPA: hypothetical protein VHC49_23715 [Mycobacteriales bacterium]|nr:hypothetical protein [Mycobacteriales bacterium]